MVIFGLIKSTKPTLTKCSSFQLIPCLNQRLIAHSFNSQSSDSKLVFLQEKMDRIGSLPEEVLSHILSFLTTKEAAITSILSKRWRNLFTLVPSLDIDDSVFLNPEEGKRERDGILQSFMDFVDKVLASQGDTPIKKFSLKCKTGIDTDRVNQWICNVLQRGATSLELVLDFPGSDDNWDSNYM